METNAIPRSAHNKKNVHRKMSICTGSGAFPRDGDDPIFTGLWSISEKKRPSEKKEAMKKWFVFLMFFVTGFSL